MSKLPERLKKLREEKNLTQSELAEELGFKNYTTITKWESGTNLPRGKELKILAELFGVSSDYILGLSDIRNINVNDNINKIYTQLEPPRQTKVYKYAEYQLEEQKRLQTINVVGQTAAGEPITYGDTITEEKEVSYIPKGADTALVVNGDSMEPLIEDGDIVFYKAQPQVENGEIAILEVAREGVTCKKVKFDYENNLVILQSLNNKYEDVPYNPTELRVLGRVIL